MSRPIFRPLTRRAEQPNPTYRETPGYRPAARLVGGGGGSGRGAMEVADQLQRLFANGTVVATQVIADRNEKGQAKGRADATAGTIDPQLLESNRAYKAGADAVRLELEVSNSEADFQEYLRSQEFDPSSGDIGRLRQLSTEFFNERWGKELEANPEYRDELTRVHTDMVGVVADKMAGEQAAAQADQDVALATELVNRDIDAGSLNAETYAAHDEKLSLMFGKREASTILARIIANEAIERGQPELIDAIPERLPNGAGTGKLNPEMNLYLSNARKAAQAQKDHNERAAEQKAVEEREIASQKVEVDITLATMEGKSVTRSVAEGLAAGLISPEKARTLLRFAEDYQRAPDEGDGEVDVLALSEDELAIINGTMSADDVRRNYSEGKYGYGRSAQKAAGRLLVMTGKPRKADGSDESVNRDVVRRAVAPPKDPITGKEPIDAIRRQADAVLEYEKLVDAGTPPAEAADAIIEKYSKRPSAQPKAQPKAVTPRASKVERVINGELPARDAGINPTELRRMRDAGEITPEQYDAFLSRT